MTTPTVNSAPVTRAVLLQRAIALVPALAERAPQAEQHRQIPAETIADLKAAGLMRIGTPDRFGGVGLDCDMIFEVAAELGRGCGSTAWCFAVWSIHNWVMGHFPEEAQHEYFAGSPETLSSSAYNPSGARATPVKGGYRLAGRWDFSSGCDAAVWATLGALGPSGPLWLLIPASDYEVDDTWHVAGLRGTGSKDIVIEDAFVPAHRVMEMRHLAEAQTVGWGLHHRPGYRAPLMALFPFTLASPVLGMARGAIEAFAAQLRTRRTPAGGTMADSVANQLRLAESAAEVDSAHLLMRHNCREILERAARGEMPPPVDRARYRRDHAYMTKLCVRAIDRLFEAAGGHALYDDNPLQRFSRDAHAASHHTALVWDAPAELYGRVALGLELPPGTRL
jgi:3-hydroxy-9,10-secoandrosta-1,3,5(10)-triene-9,17-dione monooxygenase